MSHPQRHDPGGFTLIEVLVALLVVALGIGALLTTLTSSADIIARLRDRSFAQWIALNQIAELRLSGNQPTVGTTSGTLDYAGTSWNWQEEITDPGVDGMLRVDVRVSPQPAGAKQTTPQSDEGKSMPAIGTASGFLSTSVERPNGLTPDWSFASAILSGGGGGGIPGGGIPGGGIPGGGAPQAPQP